MTHIDDGTKYINITFLNEMRPINIPSDNVDKIIIKNGFLKLHDNTCNIENGWHCYNLNNIASYYYPQGIADCQ